MEMKHIKRKLLNYLLRHLYNAITEDDILEIRDGKIFQGKRQMTTAEIQSITAEAEMLKSMDLWKILIKGLKLEANHRMYQKSASYDDMYAGKMTLWTIDLMEKKVDNIVKDFNKLNK